MWKDEVKAARKSAGLTQAKMNQLMKVPMRTIQSWEAGDRIPPEYVQILVLEKLEQIKNNTKQAEVLVYAFCISFCIFKKKSVIYRKIKAYKKKATQKKWLKYVVFDKIS